MAWFKDRLRLFTESQQYQLLFGYAPDWLANPNAIALCANLPLTEQIFTGAQCRGEIKADDFKSCRTANA